MMQPLRLPSLLFCSAVVWRAVVPRQHPRPFLAGGGLLPLSPFPQARLYSNSSWTKGKGKAGKSGSRPSFNKGRGDGSEEPTTAVLLKIPVSKLIDQVVRPVYPELRSL
eukprot:RCo049136